MTVTVTAEDGSTQDYTVGVNQGVTDLEGWQAGADLDGLIAAGNTVPTGIWSNGTTMWVADNDDDKVYAYRLSNGTWDAGRDIDTLIAAGNTNPTGIWSDGTTMWVADRDDNKLYAYLLSDGTRDAVRDMSLISHNLNPTGIWSNEMTMWVADRTAGKVYAYRLHNGTWDADRDIGMRFSAGKQCSNWHLVGRDDHVGGGHRRRQALRLPAVRREAGPPPGDRHAGCGRQQ